MMSCFKCCIWLIYLPLLFLLIVQVLFDIFWKVLSVSIINMIYKVVNNVWTFCFVWLIFRQKLQFLVYFLMEIRKVILRLKGKLYRQIFYTIKEEKQRSVITTTSGHSALLFGRWWSFDPQMASIKGNFNFIIPSIPRLFFSFVSVFFMCTYIIINHKIYYYTAIYYDHCS